MEIEIQSIHFKADQKLLDYITKKVEKLLTFYENIVSAQVYLKVENDSANNNKTLEIKLNVTNTVLFTTEHCRTFECALDLAVETLKAQLKKYKEKMRVM